MCKINHISCYTVFIVGDYEQTQHYRKYRPDAAQGLQPKLGWFNGAQNYPIYNVNAIKKTISEETKETVGVILKTIQQYKCLSFTYDNTSNTKLAKLEIMPFAFSVTFDFWQGWYNMQKRWPDNIKVKKNPDGTYTLTAKTRGLHVVKKWILGQAKNVKKITPKWLMDSILADTKEMTSSLRKKIGGIFPT